MIKVYQTLTVHNDGRGNCFNAAVASILELPLREVAAILPGNGGSWLNQWRVWLAGKGFKLSMCSPLRPPQGYSLATVHTERVYPEAHDKAGCPISHSCVAFNGVIVHDPYPLPTERYEIKYYQSLIPMTDDEKVVHEIKMKGGTCLHGYRCMCDTCTPLAGRDKIYS